MRPNPLPSLCLSLLLFSSCLTAPPASVEDYPIEGIRNVHRVGDVYLAGQPTAAGLERARELGAGMVINLRRADEDMGYDEPAAASALGLRYEDLGFRGADSMTDEIVDRARALLRESGGPVLFHCGSANRVGGVWLPYRVLDQGVPMHEALAEARAVGLRSLGYEAKAIDYIERHREDAARVESASVKPGINESFLSSDLDLEQMTDRFEGESREIYVHREAIAASLGLEPGETVVDVGAGTGLFIEALAEAVGPEGRVHALDIAPRFVDHMRARAKAGGYGQVQAELCGQDGIYLEPESCDLALICDVYHHFEFPAATMRTVHEALRPGGELVLIDFHRIPGVTREWLMNHVRAGKDEVLSELTEVGFELLEEVEIEGLEENYVLRLRRR